MDEDKDDNVETQEQILQQIAIMESEHSDLDAVIERLGGDLPFDQLKLQRLKKRKLVLKDEIAKLRSLQPKLWCIFAHLCHIRK